MPNCWVRPNSHDKALGRDVEREYFLTASNCSQRCTRRSHDQSSFGGIASLVRAETQRRVVPSQTVLPGNQTEERTHAYRNACKTNSNEEAAHLP